MMMNMMILRLEERMTQSHFEELESLQQQMDDMKTQYEEDLALLREELQLQKCPKPSPATTRPRPRRT